MFGWRVSLNAGMILAAVLLVAGGAMMLVPSEQGGALHTLGFGVVVLAGVVYFAARVAQIVKDRRR